MVTPFETVSTPETTPGRRTSSSKPRSRASASWWTCCRERLADADWRYQEPLEQLKTMTKALPAAQDAAPQPKRWWWPFR